MWRYILNTRVMDGVEPMEIDYDELKQDLKEGL